MNTVHVSVDDPSMIFDASTVLADENEDAGKKLDRKN
jgi:hypothetical protein